MESAARQTARVHEHGLCVVFARSAPLHRHAKRSEPALSTWARSDYENSDGQCHARLSERHLSPCLQPIVNSLSFSSTARPCKRRFTAVLLRCDRIAKIGWPFH